MKVSVIIPAHNEEKVIEKTLKKTLDVLKRAKFAYEIILVDDNSNDKTGEVAEKLSRKNKRIKILHKKARKKGPTGMGSALKFGFKHSTGDILIPFMGDLSDDPRHIPKLVNKLLDGYDVVCGSRFIKGGHLKDYPKAKFLINRLWNNVFDFLFGLGIKDTSNAFKAYRREVIKKIKPKSNGFDITAEIVLKAHILKFKIIEVPVSWHYKFMCEFSPTTNLYPFGDFLRDVILQCRPIKLSMIFPSKFIIQSPIIIDDSISPFIIVVLSPIDV